MTHDLRQTDGAPEVSTHPPEVTLVAGYQSGALARCTEMHAQHYARIAGFGRAFEARIAAGLADFADRLDHPCNGLWLAVRRGQIVGTVAIYGEDIGAGIAHLRWFIVDDGLRGGGVGRRLLTAAVGFCELRAFDAVHLWTFQGLHAARHLYESHGFRLVEERPGQQWGVEVLEQRFARPITRAG